MGGGVGSNLVAGGAEEAKYIDEVFSNYLYAGNSTTLSVNSGVDNTKGGMVWVKNRDNSALVKAFDKNKNWRPGQD